MRTRRTSGGFTLIELLVVIIVAGVLSAIGLGGLAPRGDAEKASKLRALMQEVHRAEALSEAEISALKELVLELGESSGGAACETPQQLAEDRWLRLIYDVAD